MFATIREAAPRSGVASSLSGSLKTAGAGAAGAGEATLAWAAGWLVLTPMSLVLAQPYSSRVVSNLALGVSELLRILTALVKYRACRDNVPVATGSMEMRGGNGYVVEYTGEAVRGLSMEGRMTMCNMSIEGGARAGMVAPDETTIACARPPGCGKRGR